MLNTNEGSAPPQNSAPPDSVNAQLEGNHPPQTPAAQVGAPPTIRVRRGVKAPSKSKTTVMETGLTKVTIEYEKPREGRKPWRVSWVDHSGMQSEMHANYDDAYTAAELKLKLLSQGQRVLTRKEIDALVAFKCQVDQYNLRLAPLQRTLEQVVSDMIAADETLRGWTASQMASFIKENHGVKKSMLAEEVVASFMTYLKSGYNRGYSTGYLEQLKSMTERFAIHFAGLYLHVLTSAEMMRYITNYRILPRTAKQKALAGPDGLAPASSKTKNLLHNALNVMFEHAKKILEALPPRMETAMQMLDAPAYDIPTPEIYTFEEIVTLYGCLPDMECVLFVSLQLFAGLRPCECQRMHKKDIKRDADGRLSFIFVRQEVGKKSPKTGRRKIRTRKAPITPGLARLLDFLDLPAGLLFQSEDIAGRTQNAARAHKFPWKHDSLRHSFITYRLALLQDRAAVAMEAGHDIAVQIAHYEGLLEELKDVEKFWNFVITLDLPATLNSLIVGTKYLRAYKLAKAQGTKLEVLSKNT